MRFDPALVAVPFRMQPGLQRLDAAAPHLNALDPQSGLFAEKLAVSQARAALHAVPGFDAANALASIRARAERDGIQLTQAPMPLELQLQQDLVVLDLVSGTVPWMCVCVPSGWAPEEKLGGSLAGIHANVADNAALTAALPHILRLLAGGACWERSVWTISPCARHDRHPHRYAADPWPDTGDPEHFARQCYLRSERQTFFPVQARHGQATTQVVFTIALSMQPLVDLVVHAQQALRLHQSLASMSEAVLTYKGLATARRPLLDWLAARGANTPNQGAQPV